MSLLRCLLPGGGLLGESYGAEKALQAHGLALRASVVPLPTVKRKHRGLTLYSLASLALSAVLQPSRPVVGGQDIL